MQEVIDGKPGISEPSQKAEHCVRNCTKATTSRNVSAQIRGFLKHLRRKRNIWVFAFRSFRGHIHTQSAKDRLAVDFGPLLAQDLNGFLRLNVHTFARSQYTEKLLSIFPWADPQDLEIFLLGFEAGSRWSADIYQSNIESDLANDALATWPTPRDRNEILNAAKAQINARGVLSQ